MRGDATCAPGANSGKLLELTSVSLITNGVIDVVPDGGLVASRNAIDEQQCDACHVQLGAHGGGRTTYDFCVTCHNPYTVQAATGTSFDMMRMTHQIHMGGDLAMPFAIWSPATATRPGEMEYPFAEVTYPQDIRNCRTCHNDSEAGSGWKTSVTIANCTSCHDSTTFAGANPTHGGGPATEDQCSACHVQSNLPQLTVAGAHAVSIAAPLAPVDAVGQRVREALPVRDRLDRRGLVPAGRVPALHVQGHRPDQRQLELQPAHQPVFLRPACKNGTVRLAFDIGWSAADFNNAGSGNGPGQPIRSTRSTSSTRRPIAPRSARAWSPTPTARTP